MQAFWSVYLFAITLIGGAITIAPWILIFAIFIAPLFFVLAYTPTIALYSWVLTIAYNLFEPLKQRYRYLLSIFTVSCLSILIPYVLNLQIYNQISKLTESDIAFSGYPSDSKSITLDLSVYSPEKCNKLCQSLLFNKAFERVVVVGPVRSHDYEFTIEKGESCPVHNGLDVTTLRRIASGECLIEKDVQKSQVKSDLIYTQERRWSSEIKDRSDFNTHNMNINKVFLADTRSGTILFQKTTVETKIFLMPLLFGPSGGGQLDFKVGFGQKKISVNKSKNENYDQIIFGDFSQPIKDVPDETRSLIVLALSTEGADRQAGHALITNFIGDFYQKKIVPSDEDMDIIVTALKDDRTSDWSNLVNFVWYLKKEKKEFPDKFVQELANRVLREKNVDSISNAIRALPEGAAVTIYPQLKNIVEDRKLRNKAYNSIARLADGGTKSLPQFINILEEYESALGKDASKQRTDTLRAIGKAPVGALAGLCLLREGALPAKDLLFSLMEKNGSGFVTDLLVSMGFSEELQMRYSSNERLSKRIRTSIGDLARSKRHNRDFCDQIR